MQAPLPFFIFCLLVHLGVYLSSGRADRRLKLMAGLAILFNTWPLWWGGILLLDADDLIYRNLGQVLRLAPFWVPLLSFIIYLKRIDFTSS